MGAAGCYWYVRNLVYTGNPIYPAQALIFSGPFGVADQARTKLITWIVNDPFNVQQWKYIALTMFNWPISIGLLALIGYAGALFALLRRRRSLSALEQQFLLLIVPIGIISVLMFPFVPFSGTYNAPQASFRPEARYVILPFLLGIVLWSTLWSRQHRGQVIFFTLSVVAVIGAWDGQALKLAALMVVVAGLLVIPKSFWDSLRKMLFSVRGMCALGLLSYSAVLLLGPVVQRRADTEVFSHQSEGHPLGEAWRALNSLPANSKIACLGPTAQQQYPVFGRRLDKVPISVTGGWHSASAPSRNPTCTW